MAQVSKPYTFSPGAVILSTEHNSNFDTIYDEFNGNISNTNISASAAIAYSKLNLTGNIVNADINASAAIVGSKLNLAAPGNIGATTPGTGRFSTLQIASGVTADNILDEDTMATNSATALATQQSIKAYVDSIKQPIVIAQFSGCDAYNATTGPGFYKGTSAAPNINTSENFFMMAQVAAAPGANNISQPGMIQFVKQTGLNTINVYTRTWASAASNYIFIVSVGSVDEVTQTVSATQNSPTDREVITVDVTSLTVGTKYAINLSVRRVGDNVTVYLSKYLITNTA